MIKILEKESKFAIDWFKMNEMIVNPDKFQAMILSSENKENKFKLNINDSIILSENSVSLLGIEIDSKLNFKNHVSAICKKASRQLNAVSRIHNYLGKKKRNFDKHFCTFKFYVLSTSMAFLPQIISKHDRKHSIQVLVRSLQMIMIAAISYCLKKLKIVQWK